MVRGLGRKLKIARIQAGYTQREVANLLGYDSDSTISSYEKSGSNPSAEILMKLAGLYKISTDYLLGLDDRKEIKLDSRMTEKQIQLLLEVSKEFIIHESEDNPQNSD